MELFEFYKKIEEFQNQKNNILATVLEGENSGSRYFFSKGDLITVYGDGAIPDEQLKEIAQAQQSRITEADGQKVFVEALKQPAHLVICGAGHVSQQVILLAAKVGFHVTVLEDRPSFAGEARRMGADRVICDSFEHGLDQIPDREDTYFLVVTRGHRYDKECLDIILKKPHCYVGMMASRGRAALLKKQMEEEGHVYFIAYKEGKPCGYVSVQQQEKDIFHLQKIYVLPHFQGSHCGSFLFKEAIKYIKEIHPEPCLMELNVNRNNKALQFYQHMGMRKLREGDFPIGNGYYMNDYIMGLDI